MIVSFSDGVNFKWNLEEWVILDYLDYKKVNVLRMWLVFLSCIII